MHVFALQNVVNRIRPSFFFEGDEVRIYVIKYETVSHINSIIVVVILYQKNYFSSPFLARDARFTG